MPEDRNLIKIERLKRKCDKLREKSLKANEIAKSLAYKLCSTKYYLEQQEYKTRHLEKEKAEFHRKYEAMAMQLAELIIENKKLKTS